MNQMIYRKLPHGEEQISILGLGTSSIQAEEEAEIENTIRYAVERGINFFDMASPEAKPFAASGRPDIPLWAGADRISMHTICAG